MAIKQRKQITGTTAQIKSFAGHEGVLAFDKQTKHLHVLSGTAGKTTELANKSDIPTVDGNSSDYVGTIKSLNFDVNTGAVTVVKSNDTAVPRKLATDLYVADKLKTKEDKGTAYSKEESDGKYSTKAEVTQGLAGKAPTAHTHTIANVTGLQEALNSASTQASNAIPKAGNRGALKGFESSTAGTTVNDSSPDTQHTGSNVTVQNGTANATASWTKVVDMTAGTVTLGSNWVWSGGKAPTLKYPGVLTCHWNGGNSKGIASYTAGAS